MRRSAASTPAASPRSSPTGWRTAGEALLLALVLGACGGAGTPGPLPAPTPMTVAFEDVGSTSQSGRQQTDVVLAADAGARATLSGLIPALPDDPGRVPLAAFQGQQRSGGHAIRIERVVREGEVLTVHARFVQPGPGDIVTMALTSPAHVVALDRADVSGVTGVVLVDQGGTERARIEERERAR